MPTGERARDSVGLDAAAARSRRAKLRQEKPAKPKPVDRSVSALEQRSSKIAGVLNRIRAKMRGHG